MQQSRVPQSLVEAYLVIDQPRQRVAHWSTALAPLDDRTAPRLAEVSAYYDPTTDQALIGLRYEAAVLGGAGLAFVVELALLQEIGMIQPAELTQGDRHRFLGERLARCTLQVGEHGGVVSTLGELVRRIRELKSNASRVTRPTSPPPARAARGLMRTDGDAPVLRVQPRGTRDDVPPAKARPRSTRDEPGGPQPSAPSRVERSPGRGSLISPHVIPRVHRAATVQLSPAVVQRQAAQSLPPPLPPSRAGSPSEPATEVTSLASPLPPGVIYARYLRSGRWVPIRIGALSLKGAALLSGALPRVNDHVDVALTFGTHRALVRGSVGKISSPHEAAISGTSTFSVSFELDDASRRQLTALLTAARAANVTIKPPPPRRERRYPVEWPVGLGTSRGVVRAEALDISREGMFVRPVHALTLSSRINFSCILDDGEPVAGRARVVRHVTEADARVCGIAAGYGLAIVDMGEDARARWLAFLERIEKRAERRVLIGASPGRLVELQSHLAALGYAVTGGTDPGALVELASAESRPVDAALIDASWLSPSVTAEWVESLFAARNVPCVTHHGDAKRARLAVDKLLAVA